MRSTRRWAVTPGPGKFFGQEVTMRHSNSPLAKAGVARTGKVAEADKMPSACLRVVFGEVTLLTPEVMKMMYRAISVPDVELI